MTWNTANNLLVWHLSTLIRRLENVTLMLSGYKLILSQINEWFFQNAVLTVSAAVKLMPRPPARVLNRNAKISSLRWKQKIKIYLNKDENILLNNYLLVYSFLTTVKVKQEQQKTVTTIKICYISTISILSTLIKVFQSTKENFWQKFIMTLVMNII